MEMTNVLVLCFFGVITQTIGSSASLQSNVMLAINPSEISLNITSSLDVQCSFNRQNTSSVASVMSILIAHSSSTDQPSFQYIASVNGIEGHPHSIDGNASYISGSIDSNSESVLRFSFKDPQGNRAGMYKCEVYGFDTMGKPVTLTSTAEVRAVEPDVNSLFAELSKLRAANENLQSKINILNGRVNVTNDCLFDISTVFNCHRYYQKRECYRFVYAEAQAACALLGGYLVELDSHEEYIFVRDFIQKHRTAANVFTGATDEAQEGVFINPHSPNPRPVFDWAPGEPSDGRVHNCQVFGWAEYMLYDGICSYTVTDPHYMTYVCEVLDVVV